MFLFVFCSYWATDISWSSRWELFPLISGTFHLSWERIYSVKTKSIFLYTYYFSLYSVPTKGLVRSPITATLPQISSRLFVTWGILWSFPEVRNPCCEHSPYVGLRKKGRRNWTFVLQVRTHVLVSSLVISWSITEVSIASLPALTSMFLKKKYL